MNRHFEILNKGVLNIQTDMSLEFCKIVNYLGDFLLKGRNIDNCQVNYDTIIRNKSLEDV